MRLAAPCHLERLASLKCGPWIFSQHADTVLQRHDAYHAFNRARGGIIDFRDTRAFHRLAQNRAVNHARHLHVDTVFNRTILLALDIHARNVFADQAKLGGRHRLHRDQRRFSGNFRKRRDLAVG